MSTGSDPSPSPGGEFAAGQPAPVPAKPAGGALSAEDLITLNEEIAAMARAGLPLDQGLSALANEMRRGRLQSVTRRLADDLRAGFTLPQALERQKGRVPGYYAAVLAAGIRSGRLCEVLGTLTLYARTIADFRDTIGTTLIYPVIILVLGFALLIFVSYAILPTYVELFEGLRMSLPPLTRFLVFVSKHPLEILIAPPVGITVGLVITWLVLRASPRGRMWWARFIYALPGAGTLIRSARLAAFADLLGILVDQAIPLPEAIRLAAEASSDPLLTEAGGQIEDALSQGLPLATALRQRRLVPELMIWMIGFGERQGTLGNTLHQVAELYRRHAEGRAALLRTILPPLLMLILAGTFGLLFIFGLLDPMYHVLDAFSGGGK